MDINPFLWISAALLFLLAEVGHPGLFFFLPFACSASLTAILAIWTDSLIIQGTFFLIASLIGSIATQVIVRTYKFRDTKHHKTNVDVLIGKHAVVIKQIEPKSAGYVTIDGHDWMARAVHNNSVAVGIHVIVVEVRGAHVVVQEVS